jgi:hypothetical protein
VSRGAALLVAATAIVIAAVVAGLRVLDSPAVARERQLDRRRIEQLQDIQRAIDQSATGLSSALPESLDALAAAASPPPDLRDPVSGERYEYRALDGPRYELCAEFAQPSDERPGRPARDFWSHGAGRQCFRLELRTLPPP